MNLNIIEENTDFIIVYKPANLATAPLKNDKKFTLTSEVAKKYPEIMAVNGFSPWEGGTVHRLDTATQGLVLIARTQTFFDFIQDQQKQGNFIKEYTANIQHSLPEGESWPACPYTVDMKQFCMTSYFRAYGKHRAQVRPALSINGKKVSTSSYSTMINVISPDVINCQISLGFRHQIRCHLAWLSCPIKGDSLYNKENKQGPLQLYCKKLFIPEYGVFIAPENL